MNPLTLLVFILGLGSLNCYDFMTPDVTEYCIQQEDVGEKDLNDLEDDKVKCYYHCLFEMAGIIVNGVYRGVESKCAGVADSNNCELAKKVVHCSEP